MIKVDLNSDLGEISENIKNDSDGLVMREISSANVACGYHAGSPETMLQTVKTAKKHGVGIGAHPSFPDRENFGRLEMQLGEDEIYRLVLAQIGAIDAVCKAEGVKLQHVKAHGALYNMAVKDKIIAAAICRAVKDYNGELILLAPAQSKMKEAAEECGLSFAAEVFADRAYNDDGSLVSRKLQGAVISDKEAVMKRVLQMVLHGKVETISGNTIPVKADSVCVHGDNPAAIELTRAIKTALCENGITVAPLSEIIK